MKVLVTGYNGQLGYDIVNVLNDNNIDAKGIDQSNLDITKEELVKKYVEDFNPNMIIHCAAFTAVDAAEEKKDLCQEVNVLGTKYLAEAAKKINAKFMYFSTDYIFEGNGENIWVEDDKPNPVNYYGQTKLDGELAVKELLSEYFILRISWVFGENGNNFINTMINLSKDRDTLNVINDQIGSPTYTKDVANLVLEMIQTNKYGVYHVTNEGFTSWYDFAKEIFKQTNIKMEVNPVDTTEFPTPAKRPLNSRMSKDKLSENGFSNLPTWEDALSRYLTNKNFK